LLEKYHPGNFRFTGLVGYSNFQYSSTREINFGSPSAGYVDRQAHGRWQSDGLIAAIGGGYEQKFGPVVFTPGVGFSYAYQLQQEINETGANSLNLQIDAGIFVKALILCCKVSSKLSLGNPLKSDLHWSNSCTSFCTCCCIGSCRVSC
jgi:hypothetical protein